ncbi:MAG: cysteine hydrolase [Desulfarculus sp.]|nr:cysteine hydrolase [Desulfarculus sp.]
MDTQCDTLDGHPLEIPGTSAALPQMRLVLDAFRQMGLPIVHIVRIYQRDGANVDLCRRQAVEQGAQILLEGSPGCQLAGALFPQDIRLDPALLLAGQVQEIGGHEMAIYKPRWGAFYRTPLQDHLAGLRVDTLVFMGCNYPNCPRTSIYQASERDFRIVLVEDAISGLYPRGRQEMLNIGVVLATAQKVRQAVLAC